MDRDLVLQVVGCDAHGLEPCGAGPDQRERRAASARRRGRAGGGSGAGRGAVAAEQPGPDGGRHLRVRAHVQGAPVPVPADQVAQPGHHRRVEGHAPADERFALQRATLGEGVQQSLGQPPAQTRPQGRDVEPLLLPVNQVALGEDRAAGRDARRVLPGLRRLEGGEIDPHAYGLGVQKGPGSGRAQRVGLNGPDVAVALQAHQTVVRGADFQDTGGRGLQVPGARVQAEHGVERPRRGPGTAPGDTPADGVAGAVVFQPADEGQRVALVRLVDGGRDPSLAVHGGHFQIKRPDIHPDGCGSLRHLVPVDVHHAGCPSAAAGAPLPGTRHALEPLPDTTGADPRKDSIMCEPLLPLKMSMTPPDLKKASVHTTKGTA